MKEDHMRIFSPAMFNTVSCLQQRTHFTHCLRVQNLKRKENGYHNDKQY